MSGIVICPMCGAQTEANKKFCPICGAPLNNVSPSGLNSTSASSTSNAASTLFSRLQNKKKAEPNKHSSVSSTPSSSSAAVQIVERKERPKVFKQKPLGIATPHETTSRAKPSGLTADVQAQLIEFLRGLNRLDKNLEASAVVRRDGSLLASAHSSRVKPEMMATITSTLFGIAEDSVRAISGGKMRIVTITAQQITLMLRPINDETILLLATGPNSNIGLITMKSELVAQNIANFLLKLT